MPTACLVNNQLLPPLPVLLLIACFACACVQALSVEGGQKIRHDKMATLPPTHTWLMKDNRYDWLSCPSDFFTTVNDIFSRQTCVSQKDAHPKINMFMGK